VTARCLARSGLNGLSGRLSYYITQDGFDIRFDIQLDTARRRSVLCTVYCSRGQDVRATFSFFSESLQSIFDINYTLNIL